MITHFPMYEPEPDSQTSRPPSGPGHLLKPQRTPACTVQWTVSHYGYLWAWSPDRQAPWHQLQAPDWLQASGEGSRRQGSGGKVNASRRPKATPPNPPEMYRRLPTAATAWATDSSIGDPTKAGPEERWGVQRQVESRKHKEESHQKTGQEGHVEKTE